LNSVFEEKIGGKILNPDILKSICDRIYCKPILFKIKLGSISKI